MATARELIERSDAPLENFKEVAIAAAAMYTEVMYHYRGLWFQHKTPGIAKTIAKLERLGASIAAVGCECEEWT